MPTAPGLRARGALLAFAALALWGCGQPAREDRSIHFSGDGSQVGFQHGNEGVFLANPAGGPPRKIFQPAADVIAVSTPLWAPNGKEVIFCTAVGRGQQAFNFGLNGSQDDPAGRLFFQGHIDYTCWRFDASGPEGTKAQQLFSASLDHAGYVGANLAVRWHPREPKIEFLSRVGANHVGLFEWDLATGKQKQAFSETAEGMIFDWTPDGSQLACVLGFNQAKAVVNGTWIGKPGAANWWHVPGSEDLAQAELPSLLETLRASRPIFSKHDSTFAFVSSIAIPGSPPTLDYAVHLANVEKRSTTLLAHGKAPCRDLVWQPDGKLLGLVQGNGATGSLHTLTLDGELSPAVSAKPVRQFVGWNGKGNSLAYITPEQIPTQRKEFWSFLLVPDALARDAVEVRTSRQQADVNEQEVLNGLRVTFPQWSPKENKLSLWVTFAPTYRSWLWLFLRYGLRPGDPAAVFDVGTGKLTWMAVNDFEKTQVGRYFHLKKDYQQAWNWYEQGKGVGAPAPALMTTLTRLPVVNEQLFYEYLCLTRLGRIAEAEERRTRFAAMFVAPPPPKPGDPAAPVQSPIPGVSERMDFVLPFMHDLLVAEVYLSLDAAEEAAACFRAEAEKADTDGKRLSALLTLSQILLIQGKNAEYLDLCGSKLVPLILDDAKKHDGGSQREFVVGMANAWGLIPLSASDFMKLVPRASVERWLPTWRQLVGERTQAASNIMVENIFDASLEVLGKEEERVALRRRLGSTGASLLPLRSTLTESKARVDEIRKQALQLLMGY
jgi:hypothetical protein